MTEKEALRIVANPHLKWTCGEVDNALTIIKNALDKQVPMKLDSEAKARGEYFCNNCYEPIPRWDTRYCPYCGQKIDWN